MGGVGQDIQAQREWTVFQICINLLLFNPSGPSPFLSGQHSDGDVAGVYPKCATRRCHMSDPNERIPELSPFDASSPVDPENLDCFGAYDSFEALLEPLTKVFGEKSEKVHGLDSGKLLEGASVVDLGLTHYKELL